MKKLPLVLLFLLLPSFAKLIVVNSQDWRFVFLSMQYAHYQKNDVVFLVSESQADIVAQNLQGTNIEVFEDSNPIVRDFDSYLRVLYGKYVDKKDFRDYRELQEYFLKMVVPKNLFIASDLEPENNIISIPIAYKMNGSVLFQSSSLFSRMSEFQQVYIVGGLSREYRREIMSVASLLGKTVNVIDRGSPYSNSLVLLDEWGPTDKVYVSTGNYLEPKLLDGEQPIVLVGSDGYNSGFIEMLDRLGVETVEVVGAELMGIARRIRDDSNKKISVLGLWGQAFTQGGTAGTPLAVDTFKIPIPEPNVTVTEVIYDPESQMVYIRYANNGDGIAYISALTRIGKNDQTIVTISDDELFLLWPGEEIIRTYSVDLIGSGISNLEANVYAKFGRYTDFLVYVLDTVLPVTVTKVVDDSSIILERVTYDGSYLRVYVKNVGIVNAYIAGQANLVFDGQPEAFPLSGILLSTGRTGVLKVKLTLNEAELAENEFVEVLLRFGERQDMMIHFLKQKAVLEIIKVRLELLAMPVIALFLILLLSSIVTRMKRRKYYKASRRIRSMKTNLIAMSPSRRRRDAHSSGRFRY